MTPDIPEQDKVLSQTATRIAIIVSGLTIATTAWTVVINPVLDVQRKVELAQYRLLQVEQKLDKLEAKIDDLERDKDKRDTNNQSFQYQKNP